MDSIRKQAHDDGYVETLYGRRLYLPEINARNKQLQQAAERTAINAPMQGTAADIIKRAMVSVEDWLQEHHQDDARMILQVHDELILEVRESAVDKIREGLEKRMSAAASLDVPLLVEAGVGNNWDEATEPSRPGSVLGRTRWFRPKTHHSFCSLTSMLPATTALGSTAENGTKFASLVRVGPAFA